MTQDVEQIEQRHLIDPGSPLSVDTYEMIRQPKKKHQRYPQHSLALGTSVALSNAFIIVADRFVFDPGIGESISSR